MIGRWGGIWSAPIAYKFDTPSSGQTDVKLTKKFDDWSIETNGVANRMPHIINNWLTTQTGVNQWGSITGNYLQIPIDQSIIPASSISLYSLF